MKNSLILSLLILISYSQAKSIDFSFYVFAAEWAGSVCSTKSCNEDQGVSHGFWNIHGLWPSDGHMGVNFCTNEPFNPEAVAPIKKELDEFWSGLYNSADAFHSHEWVKHGTCSGMNQLDYFSTVIQLAKSLDIYTTLHDNGIVPGGTYNCSDIAKVIKEQYGVETFTLQATGGYISELWMCVSKGFHPQDCPKGNVCKGQVKYPVFGPKDMYISS